MTHLLLILPLILRSTSIMDGMLRTGMVASQAHGAIIAPLRLPFYLNIMHRTTLLTQATRDTSIRSVERLGRHEELAEKPAQHVGLDLRESSLKTTVLVHHHPTGQFFTDEIHTGGSIVRFALQFILSVNVKAGKTHICIRHQYRIAGMTLPSLRLES